ncbi:hypothetical protein AB0N81_31575 [Streptomyces sp. NPDC093510]|uniref:hypothetical protein n=1 Tax=Streptomyces sp. NPDC093510 TaxID=3155199 RepID=UPI003413B813
MRALAAGSALDVTVTAEGAEDCNYATFSGGTVRFDEVSGPAPGASHRRQLFFCWQGILPSHW